MEIRDEHLSLLIELLPKYRMLNLLYKKISDDSVLYFGEQCRITDFHNEFEDKQVFEKAVLNLLLSTDKEKQMQIVSNLRKEIDKNISLYITYKDFFDGIDTLRVCTKRHDPIRTEINGKQKDCNKLWQELIQVRNSLESASWKDDKIAIQRLTQEEEKFDNLYKKEQENLQLLYEQQKESDNHASRYIKNQFDNINQLGCAFLSLLNNYYPIEKENISVSEPELEEAEKTISEETSIIEPDMIFRTGKYEKLLSFEQRLIKDKYLNNTLQWISVHENGKTDIKKLVIFLTGLHENNYFLPNKDPKIKIFFENRYQIKIGQNFERKRREPLVDRYKVVFYDYPF